MPRTKDLEDVAGEAIIDTDLMDTEGQARSRRLYGFLCNVIKGRPLLLIRGDLEKSRGGLEALRILREEMEPRDKTRSLALMRQLANWQFSGSGGLHEQLVKYEEAKPSAPTRLRLANLFLKELTLATVLTGVKEPLKSQLQLKLGPKTGYSQVREWILQYENMNAPWSQAFVKTGKGNDGGPQPMEVDVIKGKKGKGKGGGKTKGKDGKGKSKDSKGKSYNPAGGNGKGFGNQGGGWNRSGGWNQGGGWNQSGGWKQQGGKASDKGSGKAQGKCHNCGQQGHWKWECPSKGKQKGIQQVEANLSVTGSSAASTASGATSTATAYRTPSTVNRVEAVIFEDGCPETLFFDISGVEEPDSTFGLEDLEVLVIEAGVFPAGAQAISVPIFAMDSTDHLDDWTYAPELVCSLAPITEEPEEIEVADVLAVRAGQVEGKTVRVVVDSGADVSVAPARFRAMGVPTEGPRIYMKDAQGNHIPNQGQRTLNLEIVSTSGAPVTVKERFEIANVKSFILSLGRLLRSGWCLGEENGTNVIRRGNCALPITLQRNTLTMEAHVSAIALLDSGPLPPPLEELACTQGWHILPSGLPIFVAHNVAELPLESSVWSSEDWTWVAAFVRKGPGGPKPRPGDVWLQFFSMTTEEYESHPKVLQELEPELVPRHDVILLFHVDKLSSTLLTDPQDVFDDCPEGGDIVMPQQPLEDDGAGIGNDDLPEERDREPRGPADEVMDGVALSVETPLKDLKELCIKHGIATSGGKDKVLRRLKMHGEVMEKQLATEVARGIFKEQARDPTTLPTPVLPSPLQQELHAITHQPFAPWCQACVAGRSRQSPHRAEDHSETHEHPQKSPMVIQLDYCYTFTSEKGGLPEKEDESRVVDDSGVAEGPGEGPQQEEENKADRPDHRDQFGLNLLAAESTTGWVAALPLVAKGAASLRRVAESMVRLSLQLAGGDEVVVQGDPEPAMKQVLNSVEACRTKLGLRTQVSLTAKDSHQSNGVVEKAVSTIRRLALTLKTHLEDRLKVAIGGQLAIFSWLLRHAAFLHNRFFVTNKTLPPFEVVFARRYQGRLLVFGEACLFRRPTKYKGDVQWRKGIWVGTNDRNNCHVLLTEDGAFESRSIRRLPAESQWDPERVVNAKGLPWCYAGHQRRKKPLYTSTRVPLLPDTAALEELARSAGRAAAESIAANTPVPHGPDEAASDPSSSSSTSSPSSKSSPRGPAEGSGIAPASEATGGK